MKWQLFRIRINRQGYTDGGAYFGVGLPLYALINPNDDIQHEFRASDREIAKKIAKARFPEATFYR